MRIDVELLLGPCRMLEGKTEPSGALKASARGSPRDLSKKNLGGQKSAPQTTAKASVFVDFFDEED